MTDWNLKLENICGFRGSREFLLKKGVNLIIGENATGKTSIVNALKLLNNIGLNQSEKNKKHENQMYQDYLNSKANNGYIELSNEHTKYLISLTSDVNKITSYIEGNAPIMKNKMEFISKDPNVLKFSFIDKTNYLMESIEYSGSIDLIRNEIVELSNIDNYEFILQNTKNINLEYQENKEKEVKKLNDQRKELDLKVKENIAKIENYQKELNDLKFKETVSDEISNLKEQLKTQNDLYNEIRLKNLDKLILERNKDLAKNEKDKTTLKTILSKKEEIEQFTHIKDNIFENEKRIEKYDSRIVNLNKRKEDLNRKRINLLDQIKLLADTLKNNEKSSICPHCLNPIDIDKIINKKEQLNSEKQDILDNIRGIDAEIKGYEQKRDKLNNFLLEQKTLPQKLKNLNSEINSLEKRISIKDEKIHNLETEIRNKKQKLLDIEKTINKIHNKLIEISTEDNDLKEIYIELITKINLIKEENDKLSSVKNQLIQKILILPENYDILIKRTEIIINKLNDYIEDFYFDFVDSINSDLKILLKTLDWNFQKVFIDDNLNLIVKDSDGKTQSFHSLSNFEKKSISILILLIIKMRYFSDYPLFVIDEHLNSADSQRFLKFIPHLYEKILKSKIELFIVTSIPHDSDLQQFNDWEKSHYNKLTIYYKQ